MSRIMGLIRDIVLANLLGASYAADIFLLAQKIPNFLRRLFAEGAFATAFVPVFSEYQESRSPAETRALLSHVSGTLGGILLLVTLVGVLGAPLLVMIFGPGFIGQPEKFDLASTLLRITFPYILFISLTAYCGSVFNTIGRFALPAFTPVILNLCLIAAAVAVAPWLSEPAVALAWAIFAAGVLQLLIQLPLMWRQGFLVKPSWGWRDKGVQKIIKLIIPVLFGVSVSQINLMLDTQLASFLQTGSIAWLYYSDRLLEFPLGVFGIAIATVILPALSRQHVSQSRDDFNRTLNWALHNVLLIGVPAACGLAVLAEPLMITLFQHGIFTEADSLMAASSLRAYALGLPAFMLIKVLVTGFYSRQDTKTPVRIGIKAMVTNMVLNLALFYPLAHVGLALATSLAAFVNAGLLFIHLRRSGAFTLSSQWRRWLLLLSVANSLLVAAVWFLNPDFPDWQLMNLWRQVAWLLALVAGGGLVYGLTLVLLGLRLKDVRQPG